MAKNEFLAFATGSAANVTDQATWEQDITVSNGFFGGIAPSAKFNKAWRQAGFPGASCSEWINQQLLTVDILDDGVVQEWVNNFDAALYKRITGLARIRLTAPLDLYVNVNTGSDSSGDGMSPGTAWATPTAAWNYIMERLDVGGQQITVHMAPGVYQGFFLSGQPLGALNPWEIMFTGDITNPGGVQIQALGPNNGFAVSIIDGAVVTMAGMEAQGWIAGFAAVNWATLYLQNVICGPCGTHIWASSGGIVAINGSYSINGNASQHYWVTTGGSLLGPQQLPHLTCTLNGNPQFTQAFALCEESGVINFRGHDDSNVPLMSWNGGAIGPQYEVDSLGLITIRQGTTNFFPGSIAGSVDSSTFGLYLP